LRLKIVGFIFYFLQSKEIGKAGQPACAEKLLRSLLTNPQAVSSAENFGRCFSAPAVCPAFPLLGIIEKTVTGTNFNKIENQVSRYKS